MNTLDKNIFFQRLSIFKKPSLFIRFYITCFLICLFLFTGCQNPREMVLFDGKILGYWEVSDYFRSGNVYIKDRILYLEKSDFMTGVHWTGPLVKMNYQISLDAMRVDGDDFFCGLTFPIDDSTCSLILGDWDGTVCGISSIDNLDASQNETMVNIDFENGKWYQVLLRVTPNKIEAWLDGQELVNVDITDRIINIRSEVQPSVPLGIATYGTTGAIRNIKLTKI